MFKCGWSHKKNFKSLCSIKKAWVAFTAIVCLYGKQEIRLSLIIKRCYCKISGWESGTMHGSGFTASIANDASYAAAASLHQVFWILWSTAGVLWIFIYYLGVLRLLSTLTIYGKKYFKPLNIKKPSFI